MGDVIVEILPYGLAAGCCTWKPAEIVCEWDALSADEQALFVRMDGGRCPASPMGGVG